MRACPHLKGTATANGHRAQGLVGERLYVGVWRERGMACSSLGRLSSGIAMLHLLMQHDQCVVEHASRTLLERYPWCGGSVVDGTGEEGDDRASDDEIC